MKKKPTLAKLKKKAWVLFSTLKRMEDCIRTTGSICWGLCITCGKRYHFKMLQAGHFVSGRHNGNLYSERGVHAQCYNCNINLKGNSLVYRRKIIEMYGEGSDLELEKEADLIIQFKEFEIEEKINEYKTRIKKLEEENKVPMVLGKDL
jgi:hypothetical protein